MNGKNCYKTVDEQDIRFFVSLLDATRVIVKENEKVEYSRDHTEDFCFMPDLVLLPLTTDEVSKILNYCNANKIVVTARGAGTGLSGGALAVVGGVILSMKKMNKILEIDERNFQATVEPGVITQVFQEAVAEKGLFYPPDPASKGSCFIGGNLAENSGGPKALKYGVTADYVLNLEIVLANGDIMWTGANVLKNATGLNLTQLVVGSEGCLAIITKAVFKLIPLPSKNLLLLAPFKNAVDACDVVAKIFLLGISPSALEFMERDALVFAKKYMQDVDTSIAEGIEAHLLIELDGNDLELLMQEAEKIYTLLENYDCGEILIAESEAQKEKLWKLRRCIGEAVKVNSIYKEEDTVVKRAELAELLKGVKIIGNECGFKSICYGHAGDGNLHINILKGEMTDEDWNGEMLKNGIERIFRLCKKLGGTISGEHGIGYVQKSFLPIVMSKSQITLQKNIKQLFDPNQILNPEKIWE